jgi:hypothetical protein
LINERIIERRDSRAAERARRSKIAVGFDHFLAPEIADDALFGLAVLPNGFDQIQIAVGADSLLADEHAVSIRG